MLLVIVMAVIAFAWSTFDSILNENAFQLLLNAPTMLIAGLGLTCTTVRALQQHSSETEQLLSTGCGSIATPDKPCLRACGSSHMLGMPPYAVALGDDQHMPVTTWRQRTATHLDLCRHTSTNLHLTLLIQAQHATMPAQISPRLHAPAPRQPVPVHAGMQHGCP